MTAGPRGLWFMEAEYNQAVAGKVWIIGNAESLGGMSEGGVLSNVNVV